MAMVQHDENMSFDDSPMRANLDGSSMKAKLLYARRNFSHVAINVQSANLSSKSVESEISCPANPSPGVMVVLKGNRHRMMDLQEPEQSFKDSQSPESLKQQLLQPQP